VVEGWAQVSEPTYAKKSGHEHEPANKPHVDAAPKRTDDAHEEAARQATEAACMKALEHLEADPNFELSPEEHAWLERNQMPRLTAALRAFSTGLRSNRKMMRSRVFLAPLIALSSGLMPSAGCTMTSTHDLRSRLQAQPHGVRLLIPTSALTYC